MNGINSPATPSNDFDVFLAREKLRHHSEHSLTATIGEVTTSTVTTILIWDSAPKFFILIWLAVCLTHAAYGFWLKRCYVNDTDYHKFDHFLKLLIFRSFCAGFCWTLIPTLFFSDGNIVYLVYIVTLYSGILSGSLSINFTHGKSFFAFLIGISIGFTGRMFYEGESPYTTIGWMSFYYISILSYVSINMTKLFRNSTQDQFDKIQLAAELSAEKEVVEQAVKSKSKFLAAASHDLRQPINAINLFADALEPMLSKKSSRDILHKIQLSLRGLNSMLHSLLDISKLDAHAIENDPRPVVLTNTVSQLLDEYAQKAPHLSLVNKATETHLVIADPTIVERVTRNVIDNAVKYTPTGSVTIDIQTSKTKTNLIVRDTGLGIPADRINKVFDEFEQLNNPERNREKGLGLGLAIVKRLCEIADIDIKLTSIPDQGTEVMLSFETSSKGIRTIFDNANYSDIKGKVIVAIDDEKDIRDAMSLLLNKWECLAVVAESGREAIEILSKLNRLPDYIISDFRLKNNEEGTESIELIRDEFNSAIPAILITGDTAPERIVAARNYGIDVLYKPFEPEELKHILQLKLLSK